jgi:hypothetical protein
MLGWLRNQHENECNRSKIRLELFLLVRPLKSVAGYSARHPGRGDFLSMIEKAMSIMTIVFVLIILLFGFDSAARVKTRRQHNNG